MSHAPGGATRRDPLLSGVVLAGGESRRMGIDKRGIEVDGVPLLRRALDAVAGVADDLVVVIRADAPPDPASAGEAGGIDPAWLGGHDVRIVHDLRADVGPLAGIEAGLRAASHELVAVVAADMPYVVPGVLVLLAERLAARTEVDVALAGGPDGVPEPLLGVYRRRAGTQMGVLLDAGERRARRVADALPALVVAADDWAVADPSRSSTDNRNRPADLSRRAARAGGARR